MMVSLYLSLYQTQLVSLYQTQLDEVKSDVTNALAQRNYEDALGEVINRTNKELEEYFHYIISRQQLNYPPSSWDNAKLLFERSKS